MIWAVVLALLFVLVVAIWIWDPAATRTRTHELAQPLAPGLGDYLPPLDPSGLVLLREEDFAPWDYHCERFGAACLYCGRYSKLPNQRNVCRNCGAALPAGRYEFHPSPSDDHRPHIAETLNPGTR